MVRVFGSDLFKLRTPPLFQILDKQGGVLKKVDLGPQKNFACGGPKTPFLVFLDNFEVSYFLYAGRCVKKILRICSKKANESKKSPAAGWSYDFQVFYGYRNAPLPLVKMFTRREDAILNFSGRYSISTIRKPLLRYSSS